MRYQGRGVCYSTPRCQQELTEISFDLDLPIECDDEYWEQPNGLSFKQPQDKPSRMSMFIHVMRIQQLVSYALRTIVSI
jgi:hypothetical protein